MNYRYSIRKLYIFRKLIVSSTLALVQRLRFAITNSIISLLDEVEEHIAFNIILPLINASVFIRLNSSLKSGTGKIRNDISPTKSFSALHVSKNDITFSFTSFFLSVLFRLFIFDSSQCCIISYKIQYSTIPKI